MEDKATREVGRVLRFGGTYAGSDPWGWFGAVRLLDKTEVTLHADHLRCPPDEVGFGAIVTCVVKHGVALQPHAEDVSLLSTERDSRVLAKCLLSKSSEVVDAAAASVAKRLQSSDVPGLVRKLLALQKQKRRKLSIPPPLAEKLTDNQLLDQSAADIRKALPFRRALRLYQAYANPQELAKEIGRLSRSLPENEVSEFWSGLANKVEYGDSLYLVAPDDLQSAILERRYALEQEAWKDWLPDFVGAYRVDASEVYGSNLTKQDYALASRWAGKDAGETVMARMLSARSAEKAAKRFYESIGYDVTDASVMQLEAVNTDWRTYDLRLDNGKLLDVKNARAAKERPDRYVEHVVPKFKEERGGGQSVVIVGVFSPYEKLDRIRAGYHFGSIKVLGETTQEMLTELSKAYTTGVIHVDARGRNMIPAWAFSYPVECYQSDAELRAHWATLLPTLPGVREQKLLKQNFLPALLRARFALPSSWRSELGKPTFELYERLRLMPMLTLADLFLAFLNNLIAQAIRKPEVTDFDPQDYRRLLFRGEHDLDRPAGVMDPLQIMDEWCNTLQTLWTHREAARLVEFSRFWFLGTGLLQASRANMPNRKVTLLAYCGGSPKGVKCGYSPLVVGREETCESCGKLVCPKCGCCTASYPGVAPCPKCLPRMARKATANAHW